MSDSCVMVWKNAHTSELGPASDGCIQRTGTELNTSFNVENELHPSQGEITQDAAAEGTIT